MASLLGWGQRRPIRRLPGPPPRGQPFRLGQLPVNAPNVPQGARNSTGTWYATPDPPPQQAPQQHLPLPQAPPNRQFQNAPRAIANVPRDIGQSIARAPFNIAVSAIDALKTGHQQFQPQPGIQQAILGKQPVTSYQDRYTGLQKAIAGQKPDPNKSIGNQVLAGLRQKLSVPLAVAGTAANAGGDVSVVAPVGKVAATGVKVAAQALPKAAIKDTAFKAMSAAKPQLTQLDQSGKLRLPNLGGQNLHYASSNGMTITSGKQLPAESTLGANAPHGLYSSTDGGMRVISGKADKVRAKLLNLNEQGGINNKVPKPDNVSPEEAAQYAHAFKVSPEQAAQELSKLKVQDSVAAGRQMRKPQGVGLPQGVKAQLQPRIRPEPNPQTPGPLDKTISLAPVKQGDTAQPFLNADTVFRDLKGKGNAAVSEVSKLSEADQNLMKQVQTRGVQQIAQKAANPEQLIKAEAATRHYYDTRIAYDHYHGIPTPYRENYLRDLTPPKESIGRSPVTGPNKAPGYILPKENPGNTGVLEGLQRDVNMSATNHAKIAYENGLKKAFPDQIYTGLAKGEGGTTKQLLTQFGQDLSAPKDIAAKINRRVPEVRSKASAAYDIPIQAFKNIGLSGGGWHGIRTGLNYVGHETFKYGVPNPYAFVKSSADLLSGFTEKTHSLLLRDLPPDAAVVENLSGLTKFADQGMGRDIGLDLRHPTKDIPGLKQIHDATFGRKGIIPTTKQRLFWDYAKSIGVKSAKDMEDPLRAQQMRDVGTTLNGMQGGINTAINNLTPRQMKWFGRFWISPDFTAGKATVWKRALQPTWTGKITPANKLAIRTVAGNTAVAAMIGLGTGMAMGKVKPKDAGDLFKKFLGQVFHPETPTNFKTKTGIGKVAQLPDSYVSELGKVLGPIFDSSAPNRAQGAEDWATHRLSPALNFGAQLAQNKDYYGNPIIVRNQDGSINKGQSATNIIGNKGTIPGANIVKVAQGKASVGEGVLNTIGLRVAADKNDPRMKSFTNQQKVIKSLSKDDQQKYNDAHGVRTDQYGNKQTTVPAGNGAHNADILLQDYIHGSGKVMEAGAKIDAANRKLGLPGDPFYDLSSNQKIAVLLMQQDKTRNPAEAKNISDQNKSWLDNYYKQRSAYFDKLHLPPSTKIQELPEPYADKKTGADLNTMSKLSGAEKAQFIADHADVTNYLNSKAKWVNDNRSIEHRPELDTYPQATLQVQSWLKEFGAVPKGGGSKGGNKYKAQWIQSHPKEYAAISDYYTKASLYGLEENATQAQYKDASFTSKGLGDISNLAKYDIKQGKDVSGDPVNALTTGQSGGDSYTDQNGNTFADLGKSTGSSPSYSTGSGKSYRPRGVRVKRVRGSKGSGVAKTKAITKGFKLPKAATGGFKAPKGIKVKVPAQPKFKQPKLSVSKIPKTRVVYKTKKIA